MRLAKPRIAPLTEAEWTDEQRKLLEPFYQEGKTYNVLGTMAQHWDAAQKFLVWAYHVMGGTFDLAATGKGVVDFAHRVALSVGIRMGTTCPLRQSGRPHRHRDRAD
jgi:hypothetical protein